jgi:hypothetical protein
MMVPTDFWEEATKQLNAQKKVFMLAEAEQPDHMQKAFHACYGWEFHNLLKDIYKGKKNADSLLVYFDKTAKNYPAASIKMNFVSNHDENTWQGTTQKSFGESEDVMTALKFYCNGYANDL